MYSNKRMWESTNESHPTLQPIRKALDGNAVIKDSRPRVGKIEVCSNFKIQLKNKNLVLKT
jgi:hypothetical protein